MVFGLIRVDRLGFKGRVGLENGHCLSLTALAIMEGFFLWQREIDVQASKQLLLGDG